MDSGQVLSVGMAVLPGFILFTLVYTITIKVLERGLTYLQSLQVSAVAVAVSMALYLAYIFARYPFYRNRDLDNLAVLIAWIILGIVITRLARNYGIQKHGWFGLGGRANLWLIVLSWALIAVIFGVRYLMGSS
ncbi:MAG TPA: hypothetical protein VK804_00425 [Bradyrhizobium sp.]|jgi:hypothetical protein|uniref:hypothetical protein n=1 Tax=Bradyrhizobium sp. TaxID=376 RepID=UPI002BE71B0B|nr:hypothetical protein [Bradyrhizobium sp.]HTA98915.1 hypothetical protein [Bradyrhizobium sp.]